VQTENRFDDVRRAMASVPGYAERQADIASQEIAERIFRAVVAVQPDGSKNLDEFSFHFPQFRPEPRPSIRQGNVPIAQGWVGNRVEVARLPGSRELTLKSRSAHVTYFTRWVGGMLGSDLGERVTTARNKKYLAFWFGGGPQFARQTTSSVRPQQDFMQIAWDSVKDWIRQRTRRFGRFVLTEPFKEEL
jgi:hypothetical protein